jgi:hypothetical protein
MRRIRLRTQDASKIWYDAEDGWITDTCYLLAVTVCAFQKKNLADLLQREKRFIWTPKRGPMFEGRMPPCQETFDKEMKKGLGKKIQATGEIRMTDLCEWDKRKKTHRPDHEYASSDGKFTVWIQDRYKYIADKATALYSHGPEGAIRLLDEQGDCVGLLMPLRKY